MTGHDNCNHFVCNKEEEEEQQQQHLIDSSSHSFYKSVLELLTRANMPFLLGGTQAYERYTGVRRGTKDLDIFARREDLSMITRFLEENGYKTELTFPHWLAKVYLGRDFIDIIFSSANGTCPVTEHWFEHATRSTVYGLPVLLIPVEEMIFSKAYIMEKERFDGGDVNHLIRCHGPRLDWRRLLNHFDEHWRVLFGHLVLFGFVYPHDKAQCVPGWVTTELISRMMEEQLQQENEHNCNPRHYSESSSNPNRGEMNGYHHHTAATATEHERNGRCLLTEQQNGVNSTNVHDDSCHEESESVHHRKLVQSSDTIPVTGVHKSGESKICNGPLISRAQYLTDVYQWGYTDGRLKTGGMTRDDIYHWTRAMPDLVKYTEQLKISREGVHDHHHNHSKQSNKENL